MIMKKMKDVAYKKILNENSEKAFKCSKCDAIYEKQDSVRRHFHLVHGNKKFKCETCNKMFVFKTDLDRHVKNCGVYKKERNITLTPYKSTQRMAI